MTLQGLVERYGHEGKAAGAVALQIERLTASEFMLLPENFRSLVLYKQQVALIKLAAVAAQTSLEALQARWYTQDVQQEGTHGETL